MAHLVEHALRKLAHACWWADLPEVTVPSAAVTDADTERWSSESYERDLAIDRKARGLALLAVFGALISAAFLNMGTAKAEVSESWFAGTERAVTVVGDYTTSWQPAGAMGGELR